ncbi:serine hydrolase [Skermania piniformis]|uniref:Serine hydrolase n=1 Tax=Skermania pinensis TaxID=39122 RepID=A0ABX8SFP7_9ACTN|nr:serine hydrolase [Skermania piniformis]QXQ15440.1 serine hydrolase [Skermania piniformis]
MRITLFATAAIGLLSTLAGTTTTGAAANPGALRLAAADPRTAFAMISLDSGNVSVTSNAADQRAALSIAKLYLVDYVLRHGGGAPGERDLAQRAIELSDDAAADQLDAIYPEAIDEVAGEYRLSATARGSFWGTSVTSARDAAGFLAAKLRADAASPMLGWMRDAQPVAADGTEQNWGTAHLPGVIGTKWGWSDDRVSEVASASYGDRFAVAAFTAGDADAENADLAGLGG